MDRENLRELRDVLGGRRRGRQGAAAARVRPGLGRRARPRRPRPLLRRPGRLREGARPGRGRLPRAARLAAMSLAGARCAPRPAASVRSVERVGGGDINEAFRVQFADESFAFVKTRADVAPGEYAAEAAGPALAGRAGRAARAGGARRRRRRARARLGRRGRPRRRRPRSARASRRCTRRARTRSAAPRPLRLGSLVLPNDPAPDWPTFYAERRLLPLLAHAGLTRFGNRAVERVCARIARARRAARAARPAARRPVERQRAVGARRDARG